MKINEIITLCEAEGDAEGLPHLTPQLAQHISKQIETEGPHAVEKSIEWGDGAADELLAKIKEMLDDYASTVEESAAWQRKEGKNKNGGLNQKGVDAYRKEHPGSKLQTAVTTKPSKLKPGSAAAKRRKSFCARMGGMKGPMKDENGKPTRKALALRKWNCESVQQFEMMIESHFEHVQALNEGKTGPGLWANINSKRNRIKNGSGERMRKPGSKGAPTAQNFRDAASEGMAEGLSQGNYNVGLEDIGKPVTVDGESGYVLLSIGYSSGNGKLTAHILQPDTGSKGTYDLAIISKGQQGVAEGSNDTIYPNAEVIKSKNGKPVGEIYQDNDGWGCFHYRTDRGYDMIDSRDDAIQALKDLHSETARHRPDYTIKGVAEGAPELLKAEMPLVRHIEQELAQHGYQKGTAEYDTQFKHAIAMYRKFGNIDAINKHDNSKK